MAKKRSAKTSRPRSRSATAEHVTLLLEHGEEHNRATIEAVVTSRDELRREMREIASGFDQRVTLLEKSVRKNSEDIERLSEATQRNTEAIERLSSGAQRNSEGIEKLSGAIQKNTGDIAQLNKDVDKNTEASAKVERSLERQGAQFEELTGQVRANSRDIVELGTKIEQLQTETRRNTEQLAELTEEAWKNASLRSSEGRGGS